MTTEELLNRTPNSDGVYTLGNMSAAMSTVCKEDGSRKLSLPFLPMLHYNFGECRTLVKTMICAVKTISWGIASCKLHPEAQMTPGATICPYKQFSPRETDVFLRLMKWGLKAIDIYAINGPIINSSGQTTYLPQRPINTQGVRSKEEKEVLEHFAGAVSQIFCSVIWSEACLFNSFT